MELQLLKTEMERHRFRARMEEARASRGAKFRETTRSRVSEIQLTFARLYGVFDDANPNDILGGFTIHCLNEFSQSFPIPNLSHLPPSGVYEAGQLWASSHEAAQALRKGAMILVGLLQAQALLIYPLVIPRDVSTLYRVFKRVGPPFELPFAETVTGEKIFMQAMLLEGDDLRQQVEIVSRDGFATQGEHSVITFNAPHIEANSVARRPRWLQAIVGSEATARPLKVRRADASEPRTAGMAGLVEWVEYESSPLSLSQLNGATATGRRHNPGEDSSSGR